MLGYNKSYTSVFYKGEGNIINRPVTLKDVAEKSNLSLRTVKKVFAGDSSVRQQNRERILAVAKELNYSKNHMASILASNRQRHIAIVIGDYKYFFPEMREGFIQCAESLRDYKINITFRIPDSNSIQSAQKLLLSLVEEEDVDAVILHAVSMIGLDQQINKLIENGKPVFTVGADAPYSDRICFIGPKAYESGRIAAQIMANYIGKQGEVYIINHMTEHMQTSERTRGFLAVMQEDYPRINAHRVIVEEVSDYYNVVKNLVQTEEISGLLCTDAAGFMAGQVLRDVNNDDITLIGYDLIPEVEELMEEGYIKIVLGQNPAMQARVALQQMCDYLVMGKEVGKNIFTPVNIISSECLRYQKDY